MFFQAREYELVSCQQYLFIFRLVGKKATIRGRKSDTFIYFHEMKTSQNKNRDNRILADFYTFIQR